MTYEREFPNGYTCSGIAFMAYQYRYGGSRGSLNT